MNGASHQFSIVDFSLLEAFIMVGEIVSYCRSYPTSRAIIKVDSTDLDVSATCADAFRMMHKQDQPSIVN